MEDESDYEYCEWCGECWGICNCGNNESGFYGPDMEYDDLETSCIKCGEQSSDICQACGAPICHMHFELGAGFCGKCDIEKLMEEKEKYYEM